MTTVNEVVDFWLDEMGPELWYAADDALDQEVRERFEHIWWNTLNGANGLWLTLRYWDIGIYNFDGPNAPQYVSWYCPVIWVRSACARSGESGVAQWLGSENRRAGTAIFLHAFDAF
jgi:hypothetical protein